MVPGRGLCPEQYADGLRQVQAAADNASRNPNSIIAANTQFVVTGRSSGQVEDALESALIRAFALNIPAWAWAEHGARHPLGEDFGGFQDILPQTFDEQTALAHAAAVPISLLRQFVLTGTPDEVIDRLAVWRDHGVSYPCCATSVSCKRSCNRASRLPCPSRRSCGESTSCENPEPRSGQFCDRGVHVAPVRVIASPLEKWAVDQTRTRPADGQLISN